MCNLIFREFGLVSYEFSWRLMQNFVFKRTKYTIDEVWFVQHFPVFTIGKTGNNKHILVHSNIPCIHVDRGGKITYHAPGQLISYLLLDIKRLKITVRELVNRIQNSVINLLATYNIIGVTKNGYPGVYVAGAKIAFLGLCIRNGYVFHGFSININMDLKPFKNINPCGYAGMPVTQLYDLICFPVTIHEVSHRLRHELILNFKN